MVGWRPKVQESKKIVFLKLKIQIEIQTKMKTIGKINQASVQSVLIQQRQV